MSGIQPEEAIFGRGTGQPEVDHLTRAVQLLPEPGTAFLGFHLLAELGRGAFSRVFLARQAELGNRTIVLKISVDLFDESHTLAQLQHTSIVPIYSVHSASPLQAICMPYFGRTTLGDVLGAYAGKGVPQSAEFLGTLLRRTAVQGTDGHIAAPPPQADAPLQRLASLKYVDAVLWLVGQLTEGLAHAHERGILHRDLKPANVLVNEDGQPMLLDFNLAQDRKRGNLASSQEGGTLPYMAPEQLDAFQGGNGTVDERSDIYAMGVILYEALTGRLPFPMGAGSVSEVIARLTAERPQQAVELRRWNPAVTPAVESIACKCLAYRPADRYQSARQLAEDIERHLANLPLRYAWEPSVRERARKWARRHPRLTARSTISALVIFLVTCAAGALGWISAHKSQQDRDAAERKQHAATAVSTYLQAQTPLGSAVSLREHLILLQRHYGEGLPAPAALDEQLARGRKALETYEVLSNPDWHEDVRVRLLPLEKQESLRDAVVRVLFWSAQAYRYQAMSAKGEGERRDLLAKARSYNRRACACFRSEEPPNGLSVQGAVVAELLGKEEEARDARRRAERNPARMPDDFFLMAYEQSAQRNLRGAIQVLQRKVIPKTPKMNSAWLLLAVCFHNLAEYDKSPRDYEQAAGAYTTFLAFEPGFAAARLQRGWLHLNSGTQPLLARTDAKAVLDVQAAWSSAQFLHARALEQQADEIYRRRGPDGIEVKVQTECEKLLTEGVKEVTEALQSRPKDPALYFCRARLLKAIARGPSGIQPRSQKRDEDEKRAAADLKELLQMKPLDAEGWAFRGQARLLDLERLEEAARQADAKKAAEARAELARLDREQLVKSALADFATALEIEPRCLAALYHQGRMLAGLPGSAEGALKVLNATIGFYPDFLDARAVRGRLLAGKADLAAAYEDAWLCLDAEPSPRRYFQVARIYALASRHRPADRPPALRNLSFALSSGYGWDRATSEPDFAALREDPEFAQLAQVTPLMNRGYPPRMRRPDREARAR